MVQVVQMVQWWFGWYVDGTCFSPLSPRLCLIVPPVPLVPYIHFVVENNKIHRERKKLHFVLSSRINKRPGTGGTSF
jgi:hypothetical protein